MPRPRTAPQRALRTATTALAASQQAGRIPVGDLGPVPRWTGDPGIFSATSPRIAAAARQLNAQQRRSVATLIANTIRARANTQFGFGRYVPTGRTERETKAVWRGDVITISSSPYAQWIKRPKNWSPPYPAPNRFVSRGWELAEPAAIERITEFWLLNQSDIRQAFGTGSRSRLTAEQQRLLTSGARQIVASTRQITAGTELGSRIASRASDVLAAARRDPRYAGELRSQWAAIGIISE